MELLANLQLGFAHALSLTNLFYCFLGVFLGTFIGVLPGIGALATIALLLPVTFHLEPSTAVIMLAGIYYGAQYGGSTASILLNLPGTPSAVVTCLDGYPMSLQGRTGIALFMTTIASFLGSSLGIVVISLFAPSIAEMGLRFGPAEYFAMIALGLVAASTLGSGAPLKGVAMVVLGLLLGLVGADINSGDIRFTFGILALSDGLSLVALAMGLFGVSEVIGSVGRVLGARVKSSDITFRSMVPTRDDLRRSWFPMARGGGIGSFIGALPGAGSAIASFMAYAVEKRVAKDPSRFGKGAIEGVTAPEAANNAAAQSAFIPTMTLGIPGDVVMALILGALIIHGITPGPQLMTEHPSLFWGLIASFWIGNLMLLVLNLPLIGLWVRLLTIPYSMLYPSVLLFVCIGVYSVNNSAFEVLQVAAFGAVGFVLVQLRFEPAPLLLGFVLGPLMELYLRRAMLLARGDPMVFIERPISAGFLAVTAAMLLWSTWSTLRGSFRRKTSPAAAADREQG